MAYAFTQNSQARQPWVLNDKVTHLSCKPAAMRCSEADLPRRLSQGRDKRDSPQKALAARGPACPRESGSSASSPIFEQEVLHSPHINDRTTTSTIRIVCP